MFKKILVLLFGVTTIANASPFYNFIQHSKGLVVISHTVDRVSYVDYAMAIHAACTTQKNNIKDVIIVTNKHGAQGFTMYQNAKSICNNLSEDDLLELGSGEMVQLVTDNTMAGLPEPYGLNNPVK